MWKTDPIKRKLCWTRIVFLFLLGDQPAGPDQTVRSAQEEGPSCSGSARQWGGSDQVAHQPGEECRQGGGDPSSAAPSSGLPVAPAGLLHLPGWSRTGGREPAAH